MGARRIWQIAGLLVVGVGLIVMLKPFDTAGTVPMSAEAPASWTSRCGVPAVEAFRSPRNDGWFAYAPNTEAVFSPIGIGCQGPGRRRLALA